MGLRELDLDDSYRSDRNHLVEDFYSPCLTNAVKYDRAVGYFTSTSLALASQGVQHFVSMGGHMRIVASPYLTDSDAEEIAAGYEYRAIVERALVRQLDGQESSPALTRRLGLLGRLIAAGRLEIKIAFVVREGRVGIYHEKIGLFTDGSGDCVGTVGSSNETKSAYIANFESFEVYRSWIVGDEVRLARLQTDFEAMWSDATPNLRVVDFPDVAKDRLVSMAATTTAQGTDDTPSVIDGPSESIDVDVPAIWPSIDGQLTRPGSGTPSLPSSLEIRDYQREAIRSWFTANGHGMWKMATGTGKTITALTAVTRVWEAVTTEQPDRAVMVVVLCPLKQLVGQWAEEARRFGIHSITCLESRTEWLPKLQAAQAGLRTGDVRFLMVIATNATFSGSAFQEVLNPSGAIQFLIADEVHNLGAARLRALLPESAHYRLALSATPERWFDDEGTDALVDYFGPVVFELDMARALQLGALTPYRYQPILVELDAVEHEEYVALSRKIAQIAAQGSGELDEGSVSGQLKLLLIKRSNLLGAASGKIPALRTAVLRNASEWFQLVYCGETSIPGPNGHPERQIDAVTRMLGSDLGFPANTYTAETPPKDRVTLLQRFRTGNDLKFLVSMRCLDEGVDIPDARLAYLLASSTNPRQFIQRRGRILRRAPGKTVADIVDFVVVPPTDPTDPAIMEIERRLLRRELARVVEFARLALNGPEALAVLLDIRSTYGLLDI